MAVPAIADEPVIFTPAAENAGGLTVAVYPSLAAAEPVWRELETRAVMTPYQQFDWIDAYCKAGFELPGAIAILVLSHEGRAIALLPLGITRRLGVRQAQIIGMPISNCDGLVYDPRYREKLTPEALKSAFSALKGAGAAADIVSFHCLFPGWQGFANPLLAFPHAPAPNNLYFQTFEASGDAFVDHALPHKRRSSIRRSERRLSENHGEIAVRKARTAEDVERMHAAFLDQREKRFRRMGVENVFADPRFQTLFRTLAIRSLDRENPIFTYHALYAGEEIIATSLGVATPTHYSQYINSTTEGPASKYSLMGVLMGVLIDKLRAGGTTSLDMGLGDFSYKTDWTEAVTVYDSVVPISPLGAAAAPLLLAARKAKRTVKQSPTLWKVARALLAFKARMRDGRR